MRMKMVCDDQTLRAVANEFLALKKAHKVRERTLGDYQKYIDKFLDPSQNTLDPDVLKIELPENWQVVVTCQFSYACGSGQLPATDRRNKYRFLPHQRLPCVKGLSREQPD